MQTSLQRMGKNAHVAIIGAGLAGLRAADILLQSGFKVTIYEARDRIGGRVHQQVLNNKTFDMGPNWIHGTEHNPIMTLAQKTKTILHEFDGRMKIFDSEGQELPPNEGQEIFDATWGIIQKAFRYSDEYKDSIDPGVSLYDFFEQEVPKIESDPKRQEKILQFSHEWGAFVGDSVNAQSLKFFFLESTIEGETAFVSGTYRKILDEVAKTALEKAEIRYNEKVSLIETLDPTEGKQAIAITTAVSREFYDEVIVTSPLGYLQKNKAAMFATPLPPRLSKAIDNINYGRLEKVYIAFPKSWWREGESSTSDTTSVSPSFMHYLSPTYVTHPEEMPWNQELVDLTLSPSTTASSTLLFYLYGPCSTTLVQALGHHPPGSAGRESLLTEFFSPYYSRLPHYNPESPSCKPIAFLPTTWQLDDLAGNGSYTNFQVGSKELDDDIKTIREARGTGLEKGLWFAGEHTSPFVALGTTTGAYWSGEGVAKRLCRLYGQAEDLLVQTEDAEDGVERALIGEGEGAGSKGPMKPGS